MKKNKGFEKRVITMLGDAMGKADIVVKSFFFQYGKSAPSNSEYKEVMTTDSLFGGFFEYTDRKRSCKEFCNEY